MNTLLTRQRDITPRPLEHARIVNVTAHLDPTYGGICAIIPPLCSAVRAESGAKVAVAAFCDSREVLPEVDHLPVRRYGLGPHRWLSDRKMRQRFAQQIGAADLVHIHGLWREHCSLAAWQARKRNKATVISAHGMLQSWALADKRLKKAVFANLFERRNLAQAGCLHALTRSEVEDYRAFGLRTPIAIVPNGVSIPAQASPEVFLDAFPHLRGRRLILFLGRVHYKKGVDILCRAWAGIERRWPDAHLVMAGPDFANTQARIEALVGEMGIEDRVTFTGMLTGEKKWSALHAAHFFVLPSHSEGLSVSVLEAMGCGLPVIVTKQCNVPEVLANRCGLMIQPDEEELKEAMQQLLSMGESEVRNLANRGRQLVRQRYSWETVGTQMGEVYQWMLTGQLPSNVEVSLAS